MPQKMSIAQVESELLRIKKAIVRTKQEMDATVGSMEKLTKTEHIRKLLRAGRTVETAVGLEDYDENLLYLLLAMNREYLCRRKYRIVTPRRFDMMRGLDFYLVSVDDEESKKEGNE